MLAKYNVLLHDMYAAMNCVSSMFMIDECNGYACRLSSRLAEENESLIAGDNGILYCCRGK